VNGLGSAIAGVVLATTTGDLRFLLLVGFCGAFTTFSGFGWEADRLWATARDAFWLAVIVMPVVCVALFLGAWRLAVIVVG
jgi:fluoride ion exporter CrcB/FEX